MQNWDEANMSLPKRTKAMDPSCIFRDRRVITNIDNDHLDHFGNISIIEDAFVQFRGQLPFYGFAAVCGDDPGVRRCLHRFGKPFLTYGFSKDCDITAENVQTTGLNSSFSVHFKGQNLGELTIRIPGRHNILNALATFAICRYFGVCFEDIQKGLLAFRGVKRRFEICYEDTQNKRCIIDDYGHHPTEIAATCRRSALIGKGESSPFFSLIVIPHTALSRRLSFRLQRYGCSFGHRPLPCGRGTD